MAEAAKPKVNSVAIELTAHCNQKCDYCYNDWRDDNGAELVGLGGDKLLGRVRKMLDAWDIDHVTLTGGEPFSTPDVWPVLELLAERDVRAQIISNGGLINDKLAEQLAPFAPSYVQVTLNGPDATLHEEHVGEGHFARTLAGVEALRRHDITVVGCVVVTKKNAAVLGEILELWRSLGVKHIALSRFSPAGYAVSHAAQLLPSRADLMTAFEQAVPYGREHGMRINCTMPVPPCVIETQDYAPLEFGYCPIGTNMQELALGPDGQLRNCTLHKTAIGGVKDILDASVDLAELLRAPEITEYQRKLPEFCEGCVHASSCAGGCGAASEWVLGQSERRKPDPFLWQHIDDEFGARLERERNDGRRRLEVIL